MRLKSEEEKMLKWSQIFFGVIEKDEKMEISV